jgi:glutamate racemase
MERYLYRHPEYEPGERGLRRFLTTGEPRDQNRLAANFWGSALRFEAAA